VKRPAHSPLALDRWLGEPGSLKRQATTAVIWLWFQGMMRGGVGVVLTSLLAHMLGASPYGLYAIAFSIFTICLYLADAGIGSALVQRDELTEKDIHVGHTVAVTQGIAVGSLLAIIAYPLALIYKRPELFPVIAVCSIGVPINSWGIVSMALLRRSLRHRDSQWCNFAGYLAGQTIVAIPLALMGFGAWALVFGLLAQQIVQTSILYRLTRHSMKVNFAFDSTDRRFTYSILVQNAATSLLQFMDQLALGRFATNREVGWYNRAKWSYEAPLGFVVTSLQTVGLAASARSQTDSRRLGRIAIKTAMASLASGLIVAVAYTLWSKQVVHLILGPKFAPAAALLPILGIERLLWCTLSPLGAVLNGAGHPEVEAKALIVIVPFAAIVFALAAPHGLYALAVGLLIVTTMRLIVQVSAVVWVLKKVEQKARQVAAELAGSSATGPLEVEN
jgi:PST family polysaccharide transporter